MLLLTRAAISVFNLSVLSLLLTQQVQLGFEISASETVAVDFVSHVLWSAVISLSLSFKKEIILLAVPSLLASLYMSASSILRHSKDRHGLLYSQLLIATVHNLFAYTNRLAFSLQNISVV